MSAAIRLTAVDKRFDSGLEALRGVGFEVPPGQFAALLGPSGCGKSTILRLVARLERPSGGTVEVGGDVAGSAISFVFQEPTLMPWATLFDNVRLPLRIAGISRAEARNRIAPVLASLDLAGFEGAYPAELSGGMRMRASIALWELWVRLAGIPHYIVPAPSLVLATLWENLGSLAVAWLYTLQITFGALLLAVVGGVLLAVAFALSRTVELALLPFAIVLQVTPIVAIAPLILIYVQSTTAALLICAWIFAPRSPRCTRRCC